jgi:hypothetical protein
MLLGGLALVPHSADTWRMGEQVTREAGHCRLAARASVFLIDDGRRVPRVRSRKYTGGRMTAYGNPCEYTKMHFPRLGPKKK